MLAPQFTNLEYGAPNTEFSPSVLPESMGSQSKRVDFMDGPNHVIPPRFSVLTEDIHHAMWYGREDFKRFRTDAQIMACQIRNNVQSESHADVSYPSTLASIHATCVRGLEPEKGDLDSLATWFAIGASRRGLEFHSFDKRTRLDHKVRHHITIDRVLKVQMVEFPDSDSKADVISRVYRQSNEPARLFALALAKASEISSNTNTNTCDSTEEYVPLHAEPRVCSSSDHMPLHSKPSLYRSLHRGSSIHQIPRNRFSHRQLRRAST